jgi:hypothetical protein
MGNGGGEMRRKITIAAPCSTAYGIHSATHAPTTFTFYGQVSWVSEEIAPEDESAKVKNDTCKYMQVASMAYSSHCLNCRTVGVLIDAIEKHPYCSVCGKRIEVVQ